MLLTEKEANSRLNSPENLANRFGKRASVAEIPIHRPGRKIAVPNFSPVDRNEIAFRARSGEKQRELAQEFNTTQARVSQLERGQDKSLDENSIQDRLGQIRDIALEKLMSSFGLMTQEKLGKESASGLSKIAANMSRVIEQTLPKDHSDTNIQVVIYTPELRKESGFKTIDI